MERKLLNFNVKFKENKIDYDKIYASIEGWLAYANNADTYKQKRRFTKRFEEFFPNNIANVEINRLIKFIESPFNSTP